MVMPLFKVNASAGIWRKEEPVTAQAGACHWVSYQVLDSNMIASERNHPLKQTILFKDALSKLAWDLSLNNNCFCF